MAIEIAIRPRCDGCAVAVEQCFVIAPEREPFGCNLADLHIPEGWTMMTDGGLYCRKCGPEPVIEAPQIIVPEDISH